MLLRSLAFRRGHLGWRSGWRKSDTGRWSVEQIHSASFALVRRLSLGAVAAEQCSSACQRVRGAAGVVSRLVLSSWVSGSALVLRF